MLQCSRNCARLGTTVVWCRHGCSAYVGMHSEVGDFSDPRVLLGMHKGAQNLV